MATLCAGTHGYALGHIDLSSLEVDASRYEHLLEGEGDMVQLPHGNNSGGRRCKDGKTPSMTSSYWHGNNLLIDDYNQRVKQDGKSCTLTPNSGASAFRNGQKVVEHVVRRDGVYSSRGDKSQCITAGYATGVKDRGQMSLIKAGTRIRKLHPVECERLQGLPDGYTEGVSNTQRYKMLGNGWQVDTIEHILRCNTQITTEEPNETT
jgi:site-specific DNA-cytosine methylase